MTFPNEIPSILLLKYLNDTKVRYISNPVGDGEQSYSIFYKSSDICKIVCKDWYMILNTQSA